MLIVLCYKYLIMHVHIVQSDFHVRQIPFRGDRSPHTALPHLVEPRPACSKSSRSTSQTEVFLIRGVGAPVSQQAGGLFHVAEGLCKRYSEEEKDGVLG